MPTKFHAEQTGFPAVRLIAYVFLLVAGLLMAGCQTASPVPVDTPVPTAVPAAPPEDAGAVVVRLTSGEWVPYTGENLDHYGCDSWVVTEAFALEGITVEYGFFPWSRGYELSESGEWDGAIEWADTPEHRETHYLSAEPLAAEEWVFFHRVDKPFEWETMDDLAGKTIGLTVGYAYSDVFEEMKTNGTATFEEAPSDESNFKKLVAGRIDIFPIERRVGYYVMSQSLTKDEQAQLVEHPKPLSTFLPYLLLVKSIPENEQRMAAFDRGFKSLKDSGRYDEIMASCVP